MLGAFRFLQWRGGQSPGRHERHDRSPRSPPPNDGGSGSLDLAPSPASHHRRAPVGRVVVGRWVVCLARYVIAAGTPRENDDAGAGRPKWKPWPYLMPRAAPASAVAALSTPSRISSESKSVA